MRLKSIEANYTKRCRKHSNNFNLTFYLKISRAFSRSLLIFNFRREKPFYFSQQLILIILIIKNKKSKKIAIESSSILKV